MTEPFVSKRHRVYINPLIPGDGGAVLDAAIAIPDVWEHEVNGAPIIEQSHELVIKKEPKSNAPNP